MRYAVLGDLHANLGALEAVLAAIERDGVDALISVGDVVGYGAAPREVLGLLREVGATVVKGNHDAAVIGELDTRWFNPFAKAAVEWTADQLLPMETAWLADLPMTAQLEGCSVAHGTPIHPERYDYVQSTDDADPSLDQLGRGVCFVGHTHVPVTILRLADSPERTSYTLDDAVDLSNARVALVNVGSVGQPRDEDPRAAYGLFDTESMRFELNRVEYDIEREASRIRAAGLPGVLADRLYLGV
ncbi:MAG: metallophosphoesterase family protein [Planctomycetota bacterium]|nr:metallophosphoesterase family protein [Planctomycetota bacterium]